MKSNTRKKRAISKLLTLLTLGTVGASVQLPSTLAVLEDKSTAANTAADENAKQLGIGDLTADNLAGYLCYCDVEVSTTEDCKHKATAGTNSAECKNYLKNMANQVSVAFSRYNTSGLLALASNSVTYMIADDNTTANQVYDKIQQVTGIGDDLKKEIDTFDLAAWLKNVHVKPTAKPGKGAYRLFCMQDKSVIEKVNSYISALTLGLLELKVNSAPAAVAKLGETIALNDDGTVGDENVVGTYIVPKGFENLDKNLWKEIKDELKNTKTQAVPADEILRTGLDPNGVTGNEQVLMGKKFNPRLRIVKANPVPSNEANDAPRGDKLLENLEKLDAAFDTIIEGNANTGMARTKSFAIKQAKLALKALKTLGYNNGEGKAMYKMFNPRNTLSTVEQIAKFAAESLVTKTDDEAVKKAANYQDAIQRLNTLAPYAENAEILKKDSVVDLLMDTTNKLANVQNQLDNWVALAPNTPEHDTAYNVIKRDKYDGKDMQQIETAGVDKYVEKYKENSGGKTPEEVATDAQKLKDSQIGTAAKAAILASTAAVAFGGGTLTGKLFLGKPLKSSGLKDSMTRDNKPANAQRAGGSKQANAKAATK